MQEQIPALNNEIIHHPFSGAPHFSWNSYYCQPSIVMMTYHTVSSLEICGQTFLAFVSVSPGTEIITTSHLCHDPSILFPFYFSTDTEFICVLCRAMARQAQYFRMLVSNRQFVLNPHLRTCTRCVQYSVYNVHCCLQYTLFVLYVFWVGSGHVENMRFTT